ncbi:hypothetical protein [Halovenus amylolytica]|uniref:hypothetical protein n=1 Tax=Halovenus amylolytica TaxID=2500550 RepID=UPI00362090E6
MANKRIFRPLSTQGQITVPADYRCGEDGYMIEQTTNEDGERVLKFVPVQD